MDFFRNLASEVILHPTSVIEEITHHTVDIGTALVQGSTPSVVTTGLASLVKESVNYEPQMSSSPSDVPASHAGPPSLIAKYDMALGIAIDAINAQFKALYNTEVPDQDQNLDEKDREHLINWKFSMEDDVTDTSIEGYIYPPFIDITNLSVSADKHHTVRMNFKFMPDVGSAINTHCESS